jgi:APA family basic amino acid/polyamine antiporter
MLYGQTRIVMAISRDGLLPSRIAKIHPKYQTPFGTTWAAGLISGIVGGLVPLNELAELVNLGMLTVFVVISIVVIQLRYKEPDLPRKFRCPAVPVVPILSIASCILLMIPLKPVTWIRFAVWIILGLVVYFAYSQKHSVLKQNQ